jgi:hypothetical protein
MMDNNNYEVQLQASLQAAAEQPTNLPTNNGFNFDCNPFALLIEAVADLSTTDFAVAGVESTQLVQTTTVESNLAESSQNQLNSIVKNMNNLINAGGLSKQTNQDKMSLYNTEFSTDMQEGNMNTQMVQAQATSIETESKLAMQSIQGLSSLFSLGSSFYQFISGLITK